MAQYIMQEMPKGMGQKELTKYPRLLVEGKVGNEEIARTAARGTTFKEAEVAAILIILGDVVARYLAEGYSVNLDNIGRFTATLALREGVEPETNEGKSKRNAASIEVKSVLFKPKRSFVTEINRHCILRRAKVVPQEKVLQREERIKLALNFLVHHPTISRVEYVQLTGLKRTTAGNELRQLVEEGVLTPIGKGTHRVYIRSNGRNGKG